MLERIMLFGMITNREQWELEKAEARAKRRAEKPPVTKERYEKVVEQFKRRHGYALDTADQPRKNIDE
jgi:hypothetical protein